MSLEFAFYMLLHIFIVLFRQTLASSALAIKPSMCLGQDTKLFSKPQSTIILA